MKATGGEFFQKVVDHLNLLETDYFGLQYAADHAGSVVSSSPLDSIFLTKQKNKIKDC